MNIFYRHFLIDWSWSACLGRSHRYQIINSEKAISGRTKITHNKLILPLWWIWTKSLLQPKPTTIWVSSVFSNLCAQSTPEWHRGQKNLVLHPVPAHMCTMQHCLARAAPTGTHHNPATAHKHLQMMVAVICATQTLQQGINLLQCQNNRVYFHMDPPLKVRAYFQLQGRLPSVKPWVLSTTQKYYMLLNQTLCLRSSNLNDW